MLSHNISFRYDLTLPVFFYFLALFFGRRHLSLHFDTKYLTFRPLKLTHIDLSVPHDGCQVFNL
uniref:Uncharacterized protein n=1 Tax=Arundo donax TaxID=35708 RepID=A0A0A9FY38_ARUDO